MKVKLTHTQVDLLRRAVSVTNGNWFDSVEWHELSKVHDLLKKADKIEIETR